MSRSKNPLGPYEAAEHNPLIHNADHGSIRNTGHADLVDDENGNWWAVFLGVRIRPDTVGDPLRATDMAATQLGRETFLAPVEWQDGWPVVNGGKRTELEMKVDLPAPVSESYNKPTVSWQDDFKTEGESSSEVCC